MTAFAAITTGNGYNSDLSGAGRVSKAWPPDEALISQFPHVSIELGESIVDFEGESSRTINQEYVRFHIAGYIRVDTETAHVTLASKLMNAMEDLLQDVEKKICTDLMTVNANDANNPWVIALANNRLSFKRFSMLGEQRNVGMITTELTIKIQNQNISFTAN